MKINNLYKGYKDKDVSFEKLRDSIIEYAYVKVSWDKNIEAGDFLVLFIPITEDIIKNYNPQLCEFSHYINRRIDWLKIQLKTEHIKKTEKQLAYQGVNHMECIEKLEVKESTPLYRVTDRAKIFLKIVNGEINKKSTKKKFLIFVLKCSRLLDENLITSICNLYGEPKSWLYNYKDQLDKMGEERIKNREYLVHRNNRLFMEINRDEQRLIDMDDGPEKERVYKKLIEKRSRKIDIQDTLNRRSYGPKNDEIAKVLNIPKGTVDSSLFYMKKELTSLFHEKVID